MENPQKITQLELKKIDRLLDAAHDAEYLNKTEWVNRKKKLLNVEYPADLYPLVQDLPVDSRHMPPTQELAVTTTVERIAPLDKTRGFAVPERRTGEWVVPSDHQVLAVMTDVTLDLRSARFESEFTEIEAKAFMGKVEILVNPETEVVMTVDPSIGNAKFHEDVSFNVGGSTHTVCVSGLTLMGEIVVTRR